ncbi:hypothetical protein SMICM304S_02099 [Streptomyces microflavus]
MFSTLAHYRTGAPPETECRPAHIPTRMPDGRLGTMQRWVLGASVWKELLDEHGFDVMHGDTVHDPGRDGEAPVSTTLLRARKKRGSGAPHLPATRFLTKGRGLREATGWLLMESRTSVLLATNSGDRCR